MDQPLSGFQGTRPAGRSKTFEERALPHPVIDPGVESVLGNDDRVEVDDSSALPWRMVYSLHITGQNGLTMPGTGWLVGPRTVVTAGHCVFDGPNLGGFAASIMVTPGRNAATPPSAALPAINFRTLQQWIDTASPDFDIASITLGTDIGTQVGFFGVGVRPPAQLPTLFAHVSGYPKNPGNGIKQFHDRQMIAGTTERRLFYRVDTSLGQSGAPVWIVDAAGGTPLVVGIHTYGDERTPAQLRPANSATLVTTEVLRHIQEWVQQDRQI